MTLPWKRVTLSILGRLNKFVFEDLGMLKSVVKRRSEMFAIW